MKAVFDERSMNWTDNAHCNIMYLRSMERMYNDILRARGHISLMEILDDMGITLEETLSVEECYSHAWNYGKGDRVVDLGIPKEYDGNTKSFELDINI